MLRKDRSGRGGGVCFYLKSHFRFSVPNILHDASHSMEFLWIVLNLNGIKIGIAVYYRSPDISISYFIKHFEDAVVQIFMEVDRIVILGDFNVDFFCDDYKCRLFQNTLKMFNLKQVIEDPTRVAANSSTLIDYIIVSSEVQILKSGTLGSGIISDHRLVFCTMGCSFSIPPPKLIAYRNFKGFCIDDFCASASIVDWNSITSLNGLDEKVEALNNCISDLFDTHAPLKCTLQRNNKFRPYITHTIREIIKLKNKAFKRFKSTRSPSHREYYKELSNYLNFAIRQEKVAYIKREIRLNKSHPEKLWKNFAKWNVHKKPVNFIDPSLLDSEKLNNYFISAVTHSNISNYNKFFYDSNVRPGITNAFNIPAMSVDDCDRIFSTLHSNATGIDGINLKMLKLVYPFCKDIILNLINNSIHLGIFPSLWKESLVIPIAKISRATSHQHIRPISILPTLSKILEKFISENLFVHINTFDILPSMQSGFRPHFSTTTAMLKLTNDLLTAMDVGKVSILASLDFSKAFDSINHELLLSKLHYYGFSPIAISWFRSYLLGRVQRVSINNVVSSAKPVLRGVPQGSVLGPLLFILFTADIINLCPADIEMLQYADDLQMYILFFPNEIDNAREKLNKCLSEVYTWSTDNGLLLNINKCSYICIGNRMQRTRLLERLTGAIQINDAILPLIDNLKCLGFHIDSSLSFQDHFLILSRKCFAKFSYLYSFKNILPQNTKWQLVNSLILSNLDYGAPVYYPLLTGEFRNKMQVLQNCCFRYSFQYIQKREHITRYYVENEVLKMGYRVSLQYASLLYRVYHTKTPLYLHNLLCFRDLSTRGNLRRVEEFQTPRHKTAKYEGSFSFASTVILNKFSLDFTFCNTASQFRRCVKRKLMMEMQDNP